MHAAAQVLLLLLLLLGLAVDDHELGAVGGGETSEGYRLIGTPCMHRVNTEIKYS